MKRLFALFFALCLALFSLTAFAQTDYSLEFMYADTVFDFYEGLAAFRTLNGLYGYVDTNGTVVIPPIYSYASPFSDGLAPVKLGSKYGYINHAGEVVVDFQYDDAYIFSDGMGMVREDRSYGYVDTTGALVIPMEYDVAMSFKDGAAMVRNSNYEYRLIGCDGQPIDDNVYSNSYRHNSIYWCQDPNTKSYVSVDLSGNPVDTGLSITKSGDFTTLFCQDKPLIRTAWRISIEDTYPISGTSLYRITVADSNYTYHYYLVDTAAAQLVAADMYWISTGCENNRIAVKNTQDGVGYYLDETGCMALAPCGTSINSFSGGVAKVGIGDQYTFIHPDGSNCINNVFFDDATDCTDGYAAVQYNGTWRVIPIFSEN